ncbi:MAG: LysM peptidoglycan-binding domain-containing protein, partial [Wenzhouxiangellaceae bacterium]
MKKFWLMIMVAMLALPLAAQEVELRSDHPDEYIVREGDTLWDISGRFLERPWQWPAIWQANPQIDNPHLIYPGDRISLVYVDGQPRLIVNGGRRLSPEIRRSEVTGPVTTVAYSAIEPFLVKPRVVGRDELAGLPYIVANEDGRFASSEPYRAFVRGLGEYRPGSQMVIARLSYQFEEVDVDDTRSVVRQNLMRGNMGAVPSGERPIQTGGFGFWKREGKIVGYQLWEVARAEVLTNDETSQLEVLDAEFEVRAGDYILPIDPYLYDLTFYPRAPQFTIPEDSQVIGIHGGD